MDDCFMRRHEDPAGLPACGLSVFMDIRIDGSADCSKAVMAVGKNTGHREFLQPGSIGCLKDSDIGVVVNTHAVKPDLQVLHIVRVVMGFQDLPGQCFFPAILRVFIKAFCCLEKR